MELLIRFLIGGAVISAFAFIGEKVKPKTLGGIFGAAPSVSLVTLAFAFSQEGKNGVETLGRSMIVGALAMVLYSIACRWLTRKPNVPVWLAAGLLWIQWGLVASAGWFLFLRGASS